MEEKQHEILFFIFTQSIPIFLLIIFGYITWRYKKQMERLKAPDDTQSHEASLGKLIKRRIFIFSITAVQDKNPVVPSSL